jgi:hypothetical protein
MASTYDEWKLRAPEDEPGYVDRDEVQCSCCGELVEHDTARRVKAPGSASRGGAMNSPPCLERALAEARDIIRAVEQAAVAELLLDDETKRATRDAWAQSLPVGLRLARRARPGAQRRAIATASTPTQDP